MKLIINCENYAQGYCISEVGIAEKCIYSALPEIAREESIKQMIEKCPNKTAIAVISAKNKQGKLEHKL